MIKADYHIHTEDSYDSSLQTPELLHWALQNSFDIIAITEHYDLLPQEIGFWGTPSLSRYVKRLDSVIEQNPQLTILKGIEVGDYQQHYIYARQILEQFNFDIVLGSVHFLPDHTNLAVPIKRVLSNSDLHDYFLSNLLLVEQCHVDVLAHLGVYKRYMKVAPENNEHKAIIREIFKVMIDRNIALELNYACARKVYQSIIPEQEYIETYLELGGKYFTVASDAHHLTHLADNWHLIPEELLRKLRVSNLRSRVLEYNDSTVV